MTEPERDAVAAKGPDEGSLLRHAVATVAYRAGKALRGAPLGFAAFRPAPDLRTPAEILAHMGDLFDWAVALADGRHVWNDSAPLPWEREVERFFAALEAFDGVLAARERSGEPLGCSSGRLLQGPVADALNHTGQLALLRRLFGAPIRGENYFKAEIQAGRVGFDQPAPRREFD